MMAALSRRRFLTIAAVALTAGPAVRAEETRRWHGSALGARATIALAHPEGNRIARQAFAEIDRLENIFSLYRPDSALSRLNRDSTLAEPPFELLECLGVCSSVHRVSRGLFDPTVQPLWVLYAESYADGEAPSASQVAEVLHVVGLEKTSVSPARIRLPRGGALTLNGVAQGYIADRIADMLRAEGLDQVLIDTGEIHAIGGDWPVTLRTPDDRDAGSVALRDSALASSAPLGTVFSDREPAGHILDPRTGLPAAATWQIVSVAAPSAALADAISTAFVLMESDQQKIVLSEMPEVRLLAAVAGPKAVGS